MTASAFDAVQTLRGAGMRVTAQRSVVLEELHRAPHSSVDALHARCAERLPGVAAQTLHSVVNDLTAAGVVHRVSLPGAASARYELARDDNHHHLQCIRCGRVEDVDCVVGAAPCLTPSDDHGMRVLEAAVNFRAICSDCERTSNG